MTPSRFLTRSLPFFARLGLSGLLAALLIGMAASASHLFTHYENRDDQKGFTMDDVKSAYHGLEAPSKLLTSLKSGHPDTLKADGRDVLTKWIQSGRVNEDYENIDLGIASPREVIASSCLECHSAKSDPAKTKGNTLRLDTLEDIRKVAFSRKVNPNPENIVVMSMHAHALSLGTMSVVLAALLWSTRLPRGLVGLLLLINGLALPIDLASWYLARKYETFVNVIVASGGIYNGTTALIMLLVLLDLWWPFRPQASAH
jgi:hypothetical protein